MWFVDVRHDPTQRKLYRFILPEHLVPYVTLGSSVLCSTRRGEQPGEVIRITQIHDNAFSSHSQILDTIPPAPDAGTINLEDFL